MYVWYSAVDYEALTNEYITNTFLLKYDLWFCTQQKLILNFLQLHCDHVGTRLFATRLFATFVTKVAKSRVAKRRVAKSLTTDHVYASQIFLIRSLDVNIFRVKLYKTSAIEYNRNY